MIYAIKDEDFTVALDFKVSDSYVYPDEGKYTYKLRKTDGTILLSEEGSLELNETSDETSDETPEETPSLSEMTREGSSEETESTGETLASSSLDVTPELKDQVVITIPAEYNMKEEGSLFTPRLIELSFFYKGKPYTITTTYRILDFYHFSASVQDVRDYYGINSGELPDDAVDMIEVYLELLKSHGTELTNCLNSGSIGSIRANRLITLKTVVKVFPSLRLRTNQEENDGSSKFIRYMKFNWDELLQKALDEISDLEDNLSGEEETQFTDYSPFMLGSVVDAITGAEE